MDLWGGADLRFM